MKKTYRKSPGKFQSPLTRSASLQSRFGLLKRKLILVGVILVIWFGVNAVYHFRSQEISATSLMENHRIVEENLWALRWEYGWETGSRTEQKDAAAGPTTWKTWKVAGGGQLEVEFPAHQWTAQSFKARFTNPLSHTPIVLDGRAYRK